MLPQETLPVIASVISSISRAGLNVVDRLQFKQKGVSSLLIGYWNNFLPILFLFPVIGFTSALNYVVGDIFSLQIVFLSILIQCVAYSFSHAFKSLRVTDVAALTKVADLTVPLVLVIFGICIISYDLFLLLPILIAIFIMSAGIEEARKTFRPSIFLILAMTMQGAYAYFSGFNLHLDRGFWGLLSLAYAVIIWRFLFSGILLIYSQGIFSVIKFPRQLLSQSKFYSRGLLTAITQATFVFAITAKNLIVVLPILNTTGLVSAVFAYYFLGEKLSLRDLVSIFILFAITGWIIFVLNHDKFLR